MTSTPLARPLTIMEESENVEEPLSLTPSRSTTADVQGNEPHSEHAYASATPPSSPPPKPPPAESTSPLFGLRTPPRRPQFNISKIEFQTPSPPHNLPDLPGPPSSSDDENDLDQTPAQINANLLGNFSVMRTPKPPGGWALTPAPAAKLDVQPLDTTPDAGMPDFASAAPNEAALGLSTAKTPAPPGGWQATPGVTESMRRKSILKVRFDVESNTSADTTLDEVPIVGPRNPSAASGDSISQVFPLVLHESLSDKAIGKTKQSNGDALAAPERSSTPPALRARAGKSPGVRVLDAFGREKVEDDSPVAEPLLPVLVPKTEDTDKAIGKSSGVQPSPRNRSAVRIVDAMGHEVESEMSAAEDSIGPTSHKDAVRRLRAVVAGLAEDLGDSDE